MIFDFSEAISISSILVNLQGPVQTLSPSYSVHQIQWAR